LEAMKRGIGFEICYSDSLKSKHIFYSLIYSIKGKSQFTDFMSRFTDLIRLTKSRNLILSNGSDQTIYMRSPHDVANIPALLGIDHALGKKMISNHIRTTFLHGEQRGTVKGVLMVKEASTTQKQNKRAFDKL
jgi:RNase P/RNase MRP subunit p30